MAESNQGIYKNELFEIDLNKAFWEFCFRDIKLSDKIYYAGINKDENGKGIPPLINSNGDIINHVRKKSRLIALGNLAKVKNTLSFNGKHFYKSASVPARNESIFFRVAQLTDWTLKNLQMLAGDDFLFYWCDAIFFKSEKTKDLICEFLTNELDFEFKVIKLSKIEIKNNEINVWDESHVFDNLDFQNNRCKKNEIGNMKKRPFIFRPFEVVDLSQVIEFKPKNFNLKFLK